MNWTPDELDQWWDQKSRAEQQAIANDKTKPTLDGFRDINTDDGEEYWIVDVYHALEATLGELESWPKARLLNRTTGEIFEAPLAHLIGHIAEGIERGNVLGIEPSNKQPRLGDHWVVVHGVMPAGGEGKGSLLVCDQSGQEKYIPWDTKTPIPRFVRPVLNSTDDDWVVSDGP